MEDATELRTPVRRDTSLPRVLGEDQTTTLRTRTARWRHTYPKPREYYPFGVLVPGEIITAPQPPEPAYFEKVADIGPTPAEPVPAPVAETEPPKRRGRPPKASFAAPEPEAAHADSEEEN